MPDAIEGAPPACDVSVRGDGVRSLGAQGICVTLMGRITGYHWWIEYADTGQVSDLGVRGQSIYIPSSSLPRGIKSITLVGVNDKGHESDPVTWSSPSHQ